MTDVQRLAAFTTDPGGGNPAGVAIVDRFPSEAEMQAIAKMVGYSETAFLEEREPRTYRVRYFSPEAEVSFCGHATIASAVALAERTGPGRSIFITNGGPVPVDTEAGGDGLIEATFVSVTPRVRAIGRDLLEDTLSCLGWTRDDLDERLTPARAFAGAWHLVLAVQDYATLASLHYDFERLRSLMLADGLTTLQLVWQEDPTIYRVRDPFPVGGVVEDPATGAGAAAFGAYLRARGLVTPPVRITLLQGREIGRPSRIVVGIVPDDVRIRVTGSAVRIP